MAESEKYINYSAAKWHLYREFITEKETAEKAFRALSAIPAADARPVVRGKWVPLIRYLENTVVGWECSVCGFGIDISEDGFNYCPKCGADMRERET